MRRRFTMWRMGRLIVLVLCGVAGGPAAAQEGAAAQRYEALLRDSKVVAGGDIREWKHQPQLQATLAGKPLFNQANPLRVLRDNQAQVALRPPYVVLANGDVLPGVVSRYQPVDPTGNAPACLVVTMSDPLRGWGGAHSEVAVRVEQVRRVVGTRAGGASAGEVPEQPGTLLLADGRRVPVQAVRWTAEGVRVLGAQGVQAVKFADLAGVDLAGVNVAAAVLADSASPSPEPASSVGRVVTTNGAVCTFRQAVVQVQGVQYGNRGRQVLVIQPAWAVTPILLPLDTLATLSLREINQIPLSLMPAQTLAERGWTGSVWPWRRNAGVRGGELACGEWFGDLGVGTHSYSEVAFDLPPGAQRFSTTVGVDPAVGAGGCVQCRVYNHAPTGTPLVQTDFLRGGDRPAVLSVGSLAGMKRLVLVTDFAHDGRPKGADPLDIRDEVVWLHPIVEVERGVLPTARATWAAFAPGLAAWTLEGGAAARWGAQWDPAGEAWDPVLVVEGGEAVFSRTLHVEAQTSVLEVAILTTGEGNRPAAVELTIDGTAVAPKPGPMESKTALGKKRNVPAQRWILTDKLGKEAKLVLKVKVGAGVVVRGVKEVKSEG